MRRTAPRAFSCSSGRANSRANGSAGRPVMRKLMAISSLRLQSGGAQDTELLQRRHAIVQPNLLLDHPAFDPKHCCSGESHFAP